ncbi:PTS transporter subunit IIC [Paenibacillus sp. 481]|uniref:PTS transporter subunit IIC n=1 Tax=Paenibacillus sp. 481 TaxID=2835869 RepID=UPI001E555570|nr:PTS sugar transporter subunit IIC [Paenibacillus sp. 481]UHA74955.1 PTS sugar transporter subunit IIC [Paenibacillus sp. 481]
MRPEYKQYIATRVFKASNGIAQAIFITIGIGLLIESIGKLSGSASFVQIGTVTKLLMAPSIGVGIAFMLGANMLTVFSAMMTATVGAGALKITDAGVVLSVGEPVGALLAATLTVYIGKRVTGKTPLDMMAIPLASIIVGGVVGIWLSKVISPVLLTAGSFIKETTSISPFISSIVIAVVWGLLLLSPASSAGLAIALNLDGLAGGAALAGCAAHFFGFAVISARENDLGGVLVQAICTPKVQLPNITKNYRIVIPTVIASAIMGPVSTLVYGIEAPSQIAGLGICSLIAPMSLLSTYDPSFIVPAMFITYVLIPIGVSYPIYWLLRKRNWIKPGDLALPKA